MISERSQEHQGADGYKLQTAYSILGDLLQTRDGNKVELDSGDVRSIMTLELRQDYS